jgi:diguanylate cyclase (GGDEF)-like protein
MSNRSRWSVRSYLIAGFALCCAVVLGLVTVTAQSTYDRERARTFDMLALAADAGASVADPSTDQTVEILEDLAASPEMQLMHPDECRQGLAALSSATASAHIHLLTSTGAEVCSLRGEGASAADVTVGTWFDRARQGQLLVSDPLIDPISGQPAVRSAVPVAATDGTTGVLVAVVYTGTPTFLKVPANMPKGTQIVMIDRDRRLVLSSTPGATAALGASTAGTPLAQPSTKHAVRDVDGQKRFYVEAPVADLGWHVIAGLDESTALAPASRALRRNLLLGGVSMLLIGLLGVLLHRRLARPVRRLGAAIEASWRGDTAALAPTAGPKEIARVAEVFNELITERQSREDNLRERATHDVLTGLLNRAGVAPAVEAAAQGGGAVLYLDLDRFKLINDSHGHTVGDHVLRELSDRLVVAVGDGAVIGRFGGDEFVVVVDGPCDEDHASDVAGRLSDVVAVPVEVDGLRLYVGGSVGIAHAGEVASPESLIRDADTAMYHAKGSGLRWARFDENMGASVRRRLEMESALHSALAGDEFELHYQPIVTLGDRRIVATEALLRWSNPALGRIAPSDFIPVAEDTGLIVPIGAWVLETAVAQAALWAAAGLPVPVSVNIAAQQLASGELVSLVADVLRRHDVSPDLLVLEVTETTLMNTTEVASTLAELRQLGVGIAIDDFGTGYSSLAYLERMPVTELKIDRSFITGLEPGTPAQRIVDTIATLAVDLGLHVVAEGVETDGEAAALGTTSCALAQGYLFARPLPADEFTALARRGIVPVTAVH